MSIREHNPDAPDRTITRVVSDENPKAAWAAGNDHVRPGAVLTADEHGSYDDLIGLAILKRVNHSKS
ncbi:transposase [Labrys okinawensis]|uniref:transposase n=1 Tax=Labrys okinawensis TaxID=346911 RepID=UPI0039BC81E3